MKYKVGDRVKVKSTQWFNENSDSNHNVVFADGWYFTEPMSIFCGKGLIIERISHATNPPHYVMKDNMFAWIDEMIEGLVEDENKPLTYEETVEIIEAMQGIGDSWECPQGYQFKDENGNVINATKIVLEKKTKYPKTYQECCEVLHYAYEQGITIRGVTEKEEELFRRLIVLKRCRDAYWKIAGDEMGLGKPWAPDFDNLSTNLEYIKIVKGCFIHSSRAFAFPTPEMRDAFKGNFDKDLEFCKELL